ncbi:hypothetical protein BgiMline_014493 [Biomphalaria glabrata]|nr:multiple epidermal growth factor-like domains protein 11; partial [Biomphalaria glabrata]KAI8773432.1 multiple epidermal growth factor domains protein 11 [Biomphalaria glabrata]
MSHSHLEIVSKVLHYSFMLSLIIANSRVLALCSENFFGSRCQYKCQCQDLCEGDGSCVGNSSQCLPGWFGLKCQYQDMVETADVQSCLSSSDRQTCQKSSTLDTILLTWSEPQVFTWLRLIVLETATFQDIDIRFKTSLHNFVLECSNRIKFQPDEKTVDIGCDLNVPINKLKIVSKDAAQIKSIFVSGGRNVALLQRTSQSSTHDSEEHYGAQRAVDGSVVPSCIEQGCTHTSLQDGQPSWTVTFDKPYNVNKFVLYNRFDDKPDRLKYFDLQALDSNDTTIFSYHDDQSTQMRYTVLYFPGGPVASVRVSEAYKMDDEPVPIVSINEFEAFGDCVPGHWGLDCTTKCPHECQFSCHLETGLCSRPFILSSPTSNECDSFGKWFGAGFGAGIGVTLIIGVTIFVALYFFQNKCRNSTIKTPPNQHSNKNTCVTNTGSYNSHHYDAEEKQYETIFRIGYVKSEMQSDNMVYESVE